MRALGAAVLALWAVTAATGTSAAPQYRILEFDDLLSWKTDDHAAALQVFSQTCGDMRDAEWQAVCRVAARQPAARTFFELFFRPVLVTDGAPMLFTGYFEPELNGSREPDETFKYPIYRLPPELRDGDLWNTRAEIETQNLLGGRGLEIAWADNPVDVYFLHVQGSGRIRLTDGTAIRVGYAGMNGREYRSIGQELVRRGVYQPHQVSAQVIRNWVGRNPVDGRALLQHNPSYVFFRELSNVAPENGPLGAMNRSITAMRSVAVDPRYTPLGAPVWIEKGGLGPLRRLMVAQDTGSAIKGAQRADIFFGTGDEAGRKAGRVRDPGRMIVLMPIRRAQELALGA